MTRFSLPLTQLIHENLSIVVNFCFSRGPIERLFESKFVGEWKFLHKGLFEVSERRAQRACLELAMFLRLLDDEEDLSGNLKRSSNASFGKLHVDGNPEKNLGLRDVANKIIHAERLQWDFSDEESPLLVCYSDNPKFWSKAEIDIVALAGYCGNLMH
jgi:hypothetical protein